MRGSFTFSGGVPTQPDVDKLRQKFRNLQPGMTINYSDIEGCIGVQRGSFRYQTVVNAWRKKLKNELNLLLQAIPNICFQVMDAHQRIEHSGIKFKHGIRSVVRAADVALTTETKELDNTELRVRDHILAAGAAVQLAAAVEAKKLKYPIPQKSQIKLP